MGDVVYLNKGSKQGVTEGEVFSVVRPTEDWGGVEWSKSQYSILKKMGIMWEDEGRITVISVRPDVSIARINKSCNDIQRGDIVLPFIERPVPPGKTDFHFDRFAPATGKPLAMVVIGKKYTEELGPRDILYVNLGAQQGVKVGDYFRIFRYTGSHHEVAYQDPRFAFDVERKLGPTWGFGGVSKQFDWSNVPRQDIGEGVVVRTGPNAATVMITFSEREIFAGDYVEARVAIPRSHPRQVSAFAGDFYVSDIGALACRAAENLRRKGLNAGAGFLPGLSIQPGLDARLLQKPLRREMKFQGHLGQQNAAPLAAAYNESVRARLGFLAG